MSDRKAVIKNADMSEEMQQDAVDCATQALEKYNIEKVSNMLFVCCMHLGNCFKFKPFFFYFLLFSMFSIVERIQLSFVVVLDEVYLSFLISG